MDGAFDRDTLLLVENTGAGSFVTISVEDLIADRMGRYASGTAPDRLEQARLLLALNPGVDRACLDHRIREESSGDYGIADIEDWSSGDTLLNSLPPQPCTPYDTVIYPLHAHPLRQTRHRHARPARRHGA